MSPSILFVDDEPNILEGLKNLLRRQRKRWDMTFVLGGEEAVGLLERRSFDVVISDMRMPRVDGVQVLETAKARHPTATRIILSGFSEIEAAMRAVPVAQQFLGKPCEADTLVGIIERALDALAVGRSERALALVGGVQQLPTAPTLFRELELVVGDMMSGTKEISAVLGRDPAMCAKVLQLANSSFFGARQRVVSVETAVNYLGVTTLRALVLAAGAFAKAEGVSAERVEELQRHALLTGQLARVLGGAGSGAHAVTAAMVHDVGLLILESRCQEGMSEARRLAKVDGLEPYAAETRVLGMNHADVGAVLLDRWGLPPEVVATVQSHHQRPDDPHADLPRARLYLAVRLTDALPGGDGGSADTPALQALLAELGLASRVSEFFAALEGRARG